MTELQQLCKYCIYDSQSCEQYIDVKKQFNYTKTCAYYKCCVKRDKLTFDIQTKQFVGRFLECQNDK